MMEKRVKTSIGTIAVHVSEKAGTVPLVFLHGVYLDHSIWKDIVGDETVSKQTVVLVDMPMHGGSEQVDGAWDLAGCADMLLEIMDALGLDRVIAVGHSWGSMTILRAAHRAPERFEQLLLFNMPYEASSSFANLLIRLRHTMLFFPEFYAKQAAGAMMAKESVKRDSRLVPWFTRMMGGLERREVVKIDRTILMGAVDASQLIRELRVPCVFIKGDEDYVPLPPSGKTVTIPGGHLSPMEVPDNVTTIIKQHLPKSR